MIGLVSRADCLAKTCPATPRCVFVSVCLSRVCVSVSCLVSVCQSSPAFSPPLPPPLSPTPLRLCMCLPLRLCHI